MNIFKTTGVCSKEIQFHIERDVLVSVNFYRGCQGNLLAIKKLVEGRSVDEVISCLKDIPCGDKPTSCPDQLAIALQNYLAAH